MAKRFKDRDIVRVLSLMGSRLRSYLFAVILFSTLIAYFFNMVAAFMMKDVIDAAMLGDQSLLTRAFLLAAITFFIGTPLLTLTRYMASKLIKRTVKNVRVKLYEHIVSLPVSGFEDQHSGDLISRGTNDLDKIENIYWRQVQPLLMAIILGVSATTVTIFLDWRMGLIGFGLGLLTLANSTIFAKPLRVKSDKIQGSIGKLTERLTDLIQSIPVTKMFQLEKVIHKNYEQTNHDVSESTLDRVRTQLLFNTTSNILDWCMSMGSIAFGLYLLSKGQLGLGSLWAIIHLQNNATFLYSNIGNFQTNIQSSLASSSRVFELLDRENEPIQYSLSNSPLPTQTSNGKKLIDIKKLAFSYTNGKELENQENDPKSPEEIAATTPILQDLTLSIEEGQIAALVGPSGGGKSTIVKLLMGLYPIEDGQIAVGGESISQYPLAQLRNMMAYVPQDAYLFDDTIEENIRYGRPDATKNEVIAVAKAANAHGFITEQTDGYDTLVGERGARLSGGQRQRIAIARALLKDAPILLLDEATSALDSESEHQVQEALNVLMTGRTTIAIAHRLSTIENADVIYVVEKGCIVEQGVHDDLISKEGLYKELYELQFSKN